MGIPTDTGFNHNSLRVLRVVMSLGALLMALVGIVRPSRGN